MAPSIKRTIELSDEQARFVEERVARGEFPTAEDVVAAGLGALQAKDDASQAMERWLQDEVVPAYDEMMADPERGQDAEEFFAELLGEIDEPITDETRTPSRA